MKGTIVILLCLICLPIFATYSPVRLEFDQSRQAVETALFANGFMPAITKDDTSVYLTRSNPLIFGIGVVYKNDVVDSWFIQYQAECTPQELESVKLSLKRTYGANMTNYETGLYWELSRQRFVWFAYGNGSGSQLFFYRS